MHFCHEEVFAFLALFPWAGYFITRARDWMHAQRTCVHPKTPPSPVFFVESSSGPSPCPEWSFPFHERGWYFWDETWKHAYGPYKLQTEAARAHFEYMETDETASALSEY